MNSKSLISVIIPTYKRPNKIINAIKTVEKQTYSNFEIIIVDDNDSESNYRKKTKKNVLKNKKENLIYIEHKKNLGACAARNTGIENAKGEYIAFLDDDDIWYKKKLEKQFNKIKNDENIALVYCNYYKIDRTKNSKSKTNYVYRGETYKAFLKKTSGLCTSSFLIRSSKIKKIGGFDEKLTSYQDYDLLLRLSKENKIDFVEEPLMEYIIDKDGISNDIDSKIKGKKAILNKYENEYKKNNLKKSLSNHYIILGDFFILSKNKRGGIEYYIKAIVLYPYSLKYYIKILGVCFFGFEFLEIIKKFK